ncbi:hypothetical protein [Alistipes sp. ZOR0009]|uniref:hypothetical protein n=1 Tax=Alistipes sp. ZOR0009 TaxID=1339253 RepID=UPI000B25AE72|nr:hypothetical protein [Alistipes sp. ZOR0009]
MLASVGILGKMRGIPTPPHRANTHHHPSKTVSASSGHVLGPKVGVIQPQRCGYSTTTMRLPNPNDAVTQPKRCGYPTQTMWLLNPNDVVT